METKNLQTKTYVPELLPGIFTVNDSGKKIKFTRGNLFWNGSEFRCEEHAYNYPTAWDPKHVGHFYWSKTAPVAYAENYSDSGASDTDKFFAADGGAIKDWTVLSKTEWNYVIVNHLGRCDVSVAGVHCAVLIPDGVDASVVNDSYTAEQWADAEDQYGLVALPFAGYRPGMSLNDDGSNGYYWSATPNSSKSDHAYLAYFDSGDAYTFKFYRDCGHSVRLVSVQ